MFLGYSKTERACCPVREGRWRVAPALRGCCDFNASRGFLLSGRVSSREFSYQRGRRGSESAQNVGALLAGGGEDRTQGGEGLGAGLSAEAAGYLHVANRTHPAPAWELYQLTRMLTLRPGVPRSASARNFRVHGYEDVDGRYRHARACLSRTGPSPTMTGMDQTSRRLVLSCYRDDLGGR